MPDYYEELTLTREHWTTISGELKRIVNEIPAAKKLPCEPCEIIKHIQANLTGYHASPTIRTSKRNRWKEMLNVLLIYGSDATPIKAIDGQVFRQIAITQWAFDMLHEWNANELAWIEWESDQGCLVS